MNTSQIINHKNIITITIGDYHASREPAVLTTVLGSCVSVCLFDKKNLIGGMNHILMPGKPDLNHCNDSARYSTNAMQLLIDSMMRLGADPKYLTAKTFGGANVLPIFPTVNPVGKKITSFVTGFLELEGIPIHAKDMGGRQPRKIYFHTDTGDVYVKRITCQELLQSSFPVKSLKSGSKTECLSIKKNANHFNL